MKSILRGLCCAGLLASFALFASAATMTMKGMISDSMCGASHAKMMAGHPGMTDAQCTQGCVKGGAKYVFVSKGKVYQIANQDMAAVMKEAGESVSLTGDFNGDTITVSKVMMAKKK
ncbi:MAG: hypothetical protein ABSG13_23085 [Bryobacteraceae bacterium]|jgi:hypothetical protein